MGDKHRIWGEGGSENLDGRWRGWSDELGFDTVTQPQHPARLGSALFGTSRCLSCRCFGERATILALDPCPFFPSCALSLPTCQSHRRLPSLVGSSQSLWASSPGTRARGRLGWPELLPTIHSLPAHMGSHGAKPMTMPAPRAGVPDPPDHHELPVVAVADARGHKPRAPRGRCVSVV